MSNSSIKAAISGYPGNIRWQADIGRPATKVFLATFVGSPATLVSFRLGAEQEVTEILLRKSKNIRVTSGEF